MLSTSWNGKSYLFAMNGQTGRMVGELPCSKPKLALATLIFFIDCLCRHAASACMGSNAFNPAYFDFDLEGILINIVIPLDDCEPSPTCSWWASSRPWSKRRMPIAIADSSTLQTKAIPSSAPRPASR